MDYINIISNNRKKICHNREKEQALMNEYDSLMRDKGEEYEKIIKKGLWGIIVAVGLFLLSKLKWVFAIFKLAKFSTVFSMFLSLGAYAVLYGWKFGVALIYLLFVHEMGHLWAAKRKGIPTSPAIFIPFMGALIGMKEMPKNAKDEAYIAYMGAAFSDFCHFLPAIPLYIMTKEPFWALVILLEV